MCEKKGIGSKKFTAYLNPHSCIDVKLSLKMHLHMSLINQIMLKSNAE